MSIRDILEKTYDRGYCKATTEIDQALQEIASEFKVVEIMDVIVDFMRINKDPNKGFIGHLKQVGLKDVNSLAQAIHKYIKESLK